MKYLIIILTLLCIACTRHKPVVVQKFYKTSMPGICDYYIHDGVGAVLTQDSCNKYSVGDTIN